MNGQSRVGWPAYLSVRREGDRRDRAAASLAGTMTSRSGLTVMDKPLPSAQSETPPVDPVPKPPPGPEKRPPVKEPPPRELPDEEPDPNPDEKRNPPMQ